MIVFLVQFSYIVLSVLSYHHHILNQGLCTEFTCLSIALASFLSTALIDKISWVTLLPLTLSGIENQCISYQIADYNQLLCFRVKYINPYRTNVEDRVSS